MKKFSLILFSVLLSCTSERGDDIFVQSFNIFIDNTSSTPLIFRTTVQNEALFEQIIDNEQSLLICSYTSEEFENFNCFAEVLEIIFSNNRGYRCTFDSLGRLNSNDICLEKIGNSDSYQDIGNNNFQISITEEDFENAFDLSEQ